MEWRTINGYGGVYQVSNTGVVKRLHHVTINKKGVAMTFKEKRIKPFKDKYGYMHVCLQDGKLEHKMNRMKTKLDRQLKIDHLKETEDNDRTRV